MTAPQYGFEADPTVSGQTIGQIAADAPAAIPIFERYGVDYCCGGSRTLEAACRDRGLSLALIRQEIAHAVALSPVQLKDWTTAPLYEITRYIVRHFHNRARADLPMVSTLIAKVMQTNPSEAALIASLARVYARFRNGFESHMRKEETILFPVIERLQAAYAGGSQPERSSFGSLANPIRLLESEHENAQRELDEIRELTDGYVTPSGADANLVALFRRLPAMEVELHQHVHLENNVLFPRAIRMEKDARTLTLPSGDSGK